MSTAKETLETIKRYHAPVSPLDYFTEAFANLPVEDEDEAPEKTEKAAPRKEAEAARVLGPEKEPKKRRAASRTDR